jgi:hypothetical protein
MKHFRLTIHQQQDMLGTTHYTIIALLSLVSISSRALFSLLDILGPIRLLLFYLRKQTHKVFNFIFALLVDNTLFGPSSYLFSPIIFSKKVHCLFVLYLNILVAGMVAKDLQVPSLFVFCVCWIFLSPGCTLPNRSLLMIQK